MATRLLDDFGRYDRAAVMKDAHKRYRDGKRLGLGWTFSQCLSTAWAAAKIMRARLVEITPPRPANVVCVRQSRRGATIPCSGALTASYSFPSAGVKAPEKERGFIVTTKVDPIFEKVDWARACEAALPDAIQVGGEAPAVVSERTDEALADAYRTTPATVAGIALLARLVLDLEAPSFLDPVVRDALESIEAAALRRSAN